MILFIRSSLDKRPVRVCDNEKFNESAMVPKNEIESAMLVKLLRVGLDSQWPITQIG